VPSWKFYLKNVCIAALSQRSRRKSSWMVMGTTVVSSVTDSCCKVCWLSSGSTLVVVLSLWSLSKLLSITLVPVSVKGYTIYGTVYVKSFEGENFHGSSLKLNTVFTQIVVQGYYYFLFKNKDKTLQIVSHCDIIRGRATIKYYTHVHTTVY